MIKSKKTLIFMAIFFILAIIIMPTISNATSPIDNPGHYDPNKRRNIIWRWNNY